MKETLAAVIAVAVLGLFAGCSSAPNAAPMMDAYTGTGKTVEYHENGKVKREARYVDGELINLTTYYASGTKQSDELYKAGKIHSAAYYFSSGRLKAEVVADE